MKFLKTPPIQQSFQRRGRFACTLLTLMLLAVRAESAVLPLGDEQDAWSDLSFTLVSGGVYNSGVLTIGTAAVPPDIEFGSQFGPSNPGWHYGTTGTLGGTFSIELLISRLQIDASGAVVGGDNSIVTLSYKGGSPGSLGSDYGININRTLLQGTVQEVLLDAAGDNTLDILFKILGGDLQEVPNPDPNVGIFAPNKLGLFRITAPNLPSNWTSPFSFTNVSIHAFGLVPEPSAMLLATAACSLSALRRRPRGKHRLLL
jgi:hypothetical protein